MKFDSSRPRPFSPRRSGNTGTRQLKSVRIALSAMLFAGAAVLMNCGDSTPLSPPSSQGGAVAADLGSSLSAILNHTGLLTCSALPTASATQVVGPSGGVIHVGPHTLTIPRGALPRNVAITATAPSGNVNRVEFEPHGLVFDKAVDLSMSYANCGLVGQLLPGHIAYTSGLQILYLLDGDVDRRAKTVDSDIWHFSDYAIAW